MRHRTYLPLVQEAGNVLRDSQVAILLRGLHQLHRHGSIKKCEQGEDRRRRSFGKAAWAGGPADVVGYCVGVKQNGKKINRAYECQELRKKTLNPHHDSK
jgi:hypothetical protein